MVFTYLHDLYLIIMMDTPVFLFPFSPHRFHFYVSNFPPFLFPFFLFRYHG